MAKYIVLDLDRHIWPPDYDEIEAASIEEVKNLLEFDEWDEMYKQVIPKDDFCFVCYGSKKQEGHKCKEVIDG